MTVDPQLFDRFAHDYDRFVSVSARQSKGWVEGLGVHGRRAIDVGCGAGQTTYRLADDFDYVLGVDLSAPLIGIARDKRSRPNIEYRVGDLFEVADDGFDLVYSHTMMHHIADYRAGLEQLKSLVRPGGTVALVDNVSDLYPTPPRWVYTWGAKVGFPKAVRRVGLRDALFELRFWHSKPWLEHLASDVYLSRVQFREVHDKVFPGATYDDLGFALAMRWTDDRG